LIAIESSILIPIIKSGLFEGGMVFNATFNNISVISKFNVDEVKDVRFKEIIHGSRRFVLI
jgi:hypothetical protein